MSRMTSILGPEGLVARALGDRFEHRDEQIRVADAIADAMHARAHLLVEAGTGTGKSFAYLAPAMRRCLDHAETVVVVTNTISLQEQLVAKDIPLLAALLNPPDDSPADASADDPANARASRGVPPRSDHQPSHQPLHPSDPAFDPNDLIDPTYDADGVRLDDHKIPDTPDKPTPAIIPCLVKGRGNYLSIRRLKLASSRQDKLFADPAARRSLHAIEDWAYATTDGTLASLPQLERPAVWDRVQSDSGNCMGRKCPTYRQCFYQNARRAMEKANLLVCNHALFFSDLALRMRGHAFLPRYDHVVIDEAHSAEEVASEHFGLSISEGRVNHLLSTLYSPRAAKGYLAHLALLAGSADDVDSAVRLVLEADNASRAFFENIASLAGRLGENGGRVRTPPDIPNTLSPAMNELALRLQRLKDQAKLEADKFELNAYADRALEIAQGAAAWLEQSMPESVYWVESARTSDGRSRRLTLACSPVDVGPLLKEHLFARGCSVTLTSATLTTRRVSPDEPAEHAETAFAHTMSRLGCEGAATLQVGSPFDYRAAVELFVDRTMPDPRQLPPREYQQALVKRILHHADATDGGVFVLFTSLAVLASVATMLADPLADRAMPLLVQNRSGTRTEILEAFRREDRAVLLGAASFWQGVDVPGRALRNVIITRLPFDPPDRPLTEARGERIKARAGDPFREESLPRAVIRFKQGFGRLIRSTTDRGRVVVLDPRLMSAAYGRHFLAALPEGVTVHEITPQGTRTHTDDL
ncbi:MAG: helicase C-terminal domain-containing protein [Phycisphaerales bacterium]